ncbi:response regulator receiver modulated diguanylate cyclase [Marinimicrobium koreense]|uniref:diguanylate cyclase n=1 Tax=Marinimicrobium koreense TaxID=306545 RepID=A0A3N1P7H7_9GAMM|nr:diguanylate cyclase [Marinimicrobium koreense]ROQ20696.1 response regulator receiver modulated diguanylate cyclase [Marinimicrobium koreense]
MADSFDTQALNSRLDSLKTAYRQRLERELAEIESAMGTARGNAPNNDTMQALHHALHRLAGSAGTFGFPQLGYQARALERRLADHLEGKESQTSGLSTTHWAELLQKALRADERRESALGLESQSTSDTDGQRHVWLLERDVMLAEYVGQQLQSFGFEVKHLRDTAALNQCDTTSTDLLIVDHRASTVEDSETVGSDYWKPLLAAFHCPIIFTGSEDTFHARLQAVRSGARGYFAKPLDVPQLAAYAARLLKMKDGEPERVLIIEDDATLAKYCQHILEQAGMKVSCLSEPEKLLQVVSEFDPELILMDLSLPHVSGVELVAVLSQFERWAHLPIVYLSAESSPQKRTEALMTGGDAFLEKPVDPKLLISLSQSRVRRVRELKHAMTRDGLTGLMTHASIKEALEAEWQSSKRTAKAFSVVMLDIDHFKAVNDRYGHAVGNLVISAVGTFLRQHFRATDRLGRYGGEEFALILPGCIAEKAVQLVDELREAFAAIRFFGNNKQFYCTLSAGVADSHQFPNAVPDTLIEKADQALYEAKHSGRNQVCLALSD